jgi:hypothetical protein
MEKSTRKPFGIYHKVGFFWIKDILSFKNNNHKKYIYGLLT